MPKLSEIILQEEFEEGTVREVTMHDGSSVKLKKLEHDYDPTSRWRALQMMEETQRDDCLVTGLIYIETGRPALTDMYNLDRPAAEPSHRSGATTARQTMDKINAMMF